jgi:DNA-binding LytR/AlgR family response regulator
MKQTTINYKEVSYLASEINYTKIHFLEQRPQLFPFTLKRFEENLKDDFIRIHRGFLVNRNYILEANNNEVHMQCGAVLPVARRRKV